MNQGSVLGAVWLFFFCRICYTDTSSPQEDQYPPNIAVKVNHSYCSVPVSQLGWEAPGLLQVFLLLCADKKAEYRSYQFSFQMD